MNMKFLFILLIIARILMAYGLWWFQYPDQVHLKPTTFDKLPNWTNTDLKASFHTFETSCRVFRNLSPEKEVGSKFIRMQAKDWKPVCQAALKVDRHSNQAIRHFFETWFTPVAFYQKEALSGLFTGYYMPLLKGNKIKTAQYNTPIYGVPDDLIRVYLGAFDPALKHHKALMGRVEDQQLVPYYTRGEINQGAIKKKAPILAWVTDRVERQFLEIEGSGMVEFPEGDTLFLNYAAQNGRPYTSIAAILIKQGMMTRHNASMQRIREYFKTHPDKIDTLLNQNESFVFFHTSFGKTALGSQGVALTPGYSLAVDRTWVPMGTPVWLNTTYPEHEDKHALLRRLMVAQDTGGAIRGPVRGDVYWGSGERAIYVAGHMKNKGQYWLLLPETWVNKTLKN